MTLETFKSFVLVILIGLSLILTYSLWTFQPNYDRYKGDLQYVSEVDLGGNVASTKSIIKPHMMVFHKNHEYFSFKQPETAQRLFADFQEYTLANFTTSELTDLTTENHLLEIMFPESLPLEMIQSLFTLEDPDISLPKWTFKTMYLVFAEDDSQIDVHFLSTDEQEQVVFTIESSRAITHLLSTFLQEDNLERYFLVEDLSPHIYLPEDQPEIQTRTLAIERVSPSKLVDALFSNPALVSPNVGEAYYTDGQRGMRVLNDRKSIEYINPIQSSYEHMDKMDLLDASISKINDHAGWTDDFYLDTIVSSLNQVVYRMHYDDYPIFHQGDLSIIDHQWRQQDVYKYKRPIFHLKSSFGGNTIHLPSGHELMTYLHGHLENNIDHVRDIRLGYNLIYSDSEPYSVNLEPAWFMNYNGQWQVIRMVDPNHDEGSVK